LDVSSIPILADAIREYYEISELVGLCDLFDVACDDIKYDGLGSENARLGHFEFARTLITQIEHGNNRRFLETLVSSLTTRCRERIVHTQWEHPDYHRQMLARLLALVTQLEEGGKTPAEFTVPEGHPFSAKSEAREFIGDADTEVTVVDNYIGVGTLDCLRDVQRRVRLLTGAHDNSIETDFQRALKDFRSEGHAIEVRRHWKLHDRYILFNDRCWLVGSSLKDAGKKTFSVIDVVRPKSWTPGIINKPSLRKGCPDAKTPQFHARIQSPGDT
jgi:hypothetical protein